MDDWTANHGGPRLTTRGFVIHSTRGGLDDPSKEYSSTRNWFKNPASEASSTIVIADSGEICNMVALPNVCWTTGYHNAEYAAVELCQPRLGASISDAQMKALAWYLRFVFFPAYPSLKPSPTTLPFHSELPQGISEGKTDLFARNAPDGIAWRNSLLKLL